MNRIIQIILYSLIGWLTIDLIGVGIAVFVFGMNVENPNSTFILILTCIEMMWFLGVLSASSSKATKAKGGADEE